MCIPYSRYADYTHSDATLPAPKAAQCACLGRHQSGGHAAVFLMTNFITGSILEVDGGALLT